MNAPKQSAAVRELRDWRVWLIAPVCALVAGHEALTRLGRWALLLALPVAALAFAGAAIWLLRRPTKRTGFVAEATEALHAHLPPGTLPPRVLQARQTGEVWEVEWRLPARTAGPALIKKTRDLEHELGAPLQLRIDRYRLLMKAGTAEIPELVTYEDFYRYQEPEGDFNPNLEPHWQTFDPRSVASPDPAVVGFIVAPPVG